LAVFVVCAVASETDLETDFSPVTCGSIIKLKHAATGYRLHSHDIKLGSGSGQQSVTAVSQSDDHNSLWLIKSRDATVVCPRGTPVKNGQQIRLMHLQTKKHLQTFQQHLAALSRQQEVSAPADGGAWEIVVLDGNLWGRGADVLLKHVETGAYLMAREDFDYNANNCGQQCPIAGHLEVSTTIQVDKYRHAIKWHTAEGVYWPRGAKEGTEIPLAVAKIAGTVAAGPATDEAMHEASEFMAGSTWHWNEWRDVTFARGGKFDAPTDDCQRGDCSWSVGAGGEILIEWGEAGKHSVRISSDRQSISGFRVKDREKCAATFVKKA